MNNDQLHELLFLTSLGSDPETETSGRHGDKIARPGWT